MARLAAASAPIPAGAHRPFPAQEPLLNLSSILLDEILPRVEKPSRYLGNELNVAEPAAPGDLRIALAFPDLYDVGLSNLGILILYRILNAMDGVSAERSYAPGVDLEQRMRQRGIPMFSWETKTPLREFDAIGFSIQYELAATNILTMLDLGGVPLRSEDRGDDDPVILAGGPCVYHPEPYARFVDAFVIGDGEEAVVGMANVLRETRGAKRAERLEALTEVPGVYVPLLYPTVRGVDGTILPDPSGPRIKKAMIRSLDAQPFPTDYIVPFTQQVHDRVSMEVLRGCTQGCRFCQAGMTYRPVRERSLETVGTLLDRTIRATGYDEVSLSSLSTCDYSRVNHLVENSVQQLTPRGVSVTLPSIRTDSFSVELSEMVATAKKSGITFAPEAATPRLRALIDKWIPDDELLETTDFVFARGWNKVKLYFMIGHPTETDEDVEAIARLSRQVLERGRKLCPGAHVNVGVSTFVPKPFTPFQWERQIGMEETRHKQALLRRAMNVRGIRLRPHEAENSWLEGLVSRGDRSVGELFELAWNEGCRLDGWSEHFDFAKWQRAVEKWGQDPEHLLRERSVDEPLPWDHIDIFIEKKYLAKDLAKAKSEAEQAALTADCRTGCHVCGVIHEDKQLCNTMIRTYKRGAKEIAEWKPKPPPKTIWEMPDVGKMRFRFAKDDSVRLLSHLELMGSMQRTLRRANVPVGYSNGFSPHMKLAFGDALPVGLSSEGEYADVRLRAPVDAERFVRDMNAACPRGVRVLAATPVEVHSPSLTAKVEAARYRVDLARCGVTPELVRDRIEEFGRREEWMVEKRVQKKRGEKIIRFDLKELVRTVEADGDEPRMNMLIGRRGGNLGRPRELLMALFDLDTDRVLDARVHKVDSFVEFDGRLVSVGSGWGAAERFDPYADRSGPSAQRIRGRRPRRVASAVKGVTRR